jgi:antitoxin component YwqK of YwqJK toxin-antitoxin module
MQLAEPIVSSPGGESNLEERRRDELSDGEEHGQSKTFRTDGTLSRIDHYENGVRQGPSIFYGLKDEVLVQLNYKVVMLEK